MSVVSDFILMVVKKIGVVSLVSEATRHSERSQRFHLNSSKLKQRSESS